MQFDIYMRFYPKSVEKKYVLLTFLTRITDTLRGNVEHL